MFRRMLIANRGDVAARVARTARRLGVEIVAVASEVDAEHSWLECADTVVRLGASRSAASYLNQDALLEVALHHGCSAIHPGWGFLAESATFASRCREAGLQWIGPQAGLMDTLADKVRARAMAASVGLPPIPGSDGPVAGLSQARRVAAELGYPVLLKAASGGGGRGMRAVDDEIELELVFEQASAEALSSFGDGRLYLERRLSQARHVEVQIVGDRYGQVVHLGDRECSLQRRWQKVVEESPSPALDARTRGALLEHVRSAMQRMGYRNAGTVELLVDAQGQAWFMEVNARLQVEHGISEVRAGIDLVEWQLRAAANQPLPLSQDQIQLHGHSIELRLNAEDPDAGFRPSPGRISRLDLPDVEGVRFDTHLQPGDRVPPDYDSLVARIICHAPDRQQAIARLVRALEGLRVEGVCTNQGLLRRILHWQPFLSGNYHTGSLEELVS